MISRELLDMVCAALADGKAQQAGIVQTLRAAFPGVAFTVCNDNDIPSRIKPLVRGEGFALYGIGSSGHCAQLTADPEAANGLTIALIDDED